MKHLVGGILMLVSMLANAGNLSTMTVEEKCEMWAKNAVYGAIQFARGAEREIVFVPISVFVEMMEHQQKAPKLYIIVDKDNTPEEFKFLSQSTLAGYDKRKKWSEERTDLPDLGDFIQDSTYQCLESYR